MGEIIWIVLFVVMMTCPFLLMTGKGRWLWFGVMGWIMASFGIGEGVAKLVSGGTLSQAFWKYSLNHPLTAWIILGCLAAAWTSLLIHLAWKMLRRQK